jgi:hypothetical protein
LRNSGIKAVLTRKIRESTHTLVVIGQYANSYHPDRDKIGERNWQWWEIKKSIEEGKRLVGVKIERDYSSPIPLLNAGATWAQSFKVEAIQKAIEAA